MSLVIVCPGCERTLRVSEQAAGKTIKCPRCEEKFVAPAATAEDAVTVAPQPESAARKPRPGSAQAVTNQPPPEEEPAAPPPRRRRPRFEPFSIRVMIKDPDGELKGNRAAQVTPDGIELKVKKKTVLLEVGSDARYVKGNKIKVDYEDRWLELTILKPFHYMNRLSADLADFLGGELETMHLADYRAPWYVFLPAILPLGIPIITRGGGIPCGVAGGFVGAAIAIGQKESWPIPVRLVASTALGLSGYGITLLVVYLVYGTIDVIFW